MSSIYGIPDNLLVFATTSALSAYNVSTPVNGEVVGNGQLAQVNTTGIFQYFKNQGSYVVDGATVLSATPTGVWVEYFLATGQTYIAINDSTNNIIGAAIADIPLTNGHIFVGNASGVATDVAMSGNVTISNSGATTIGAAQVTKSMLASGINPGAILAAAGTAAYAGGSATATFTITGMLDGDFLTVQIVASTNAVNVQKVSHSGTTATVVMSGDPGAATTFVYHLARTAS